MARDGSRRATRPSWRPRARLQPLTPTTAARTIAFMLRTGRRSGNRCAASSEAVHEGGLSCREGRDEFTLGKRRSLARGVSIFAEACRQLLRHDIACRSATRTLAWDCVPDQAAPQREWSPVVPSPLYPPVTHPPAQVVAGALSGMMTKTSVAPIERLKVIVQTEGMRTQGKRSVGQIFRRDGCWGPSHPATALATHRRPPLRRRLSSAGVVTAMSRAE